MDQKWVENVSKRAKKGQKIAQKWGQKWAKNRAKKLENGQKIGAKMDRKSVNNGAQNGAKMGAKIGKKSGKKSRKWGKKWGQKWTGFRKFSTKTLKLLGFRPLYFSTLKGGNLCHPPVTPYAPSLAIFLTGNISPLHLTLSLANSV